MALSYPLLKQNLKYIEHTHFVKYTEVEGTELRISFLDTSLSRHSFNFYMNLSDPTQWSLTSYRFTDLDTFFEMVKIFRMDKLIRNEKLHYGLDSPHVIDRIATENKFCIMICALALSKSSDDVKKLISDSCHKYQILRLYLPVEISLEISSYFILFILMNY